MSKEISTHDLRIGFGKYKGELWTRLPIRYLFWLANLKPGSGDIRDIKMARSEIKRRGAKLPEIEISAHAIDRASIKCRRTWQQTKKNREEGIYSWLLRISMKALKTCRRNIIVCNGLKLVFEYGKYYPTLTSIMPAKKKDYYENNEEVPE